MATIMPSRQTIDRTPNLLWILGVFLVAGGARLSAAPDDGAFWEPTIRAFEVEDRESRPPRGGVVFVGSSSIRLWNLARDFPGQPFVNRGFGGSELADSVTFADRIVTPYQPRAVVLYAGDNDLANGKSPHQIHCDFCDFAKRVHRAQPAAVIYFISIKPSPQRWKLFPLAQRTNRRIQETCRHDPLLTFVDVTPLMLGPNGKPRPELYA
ncbi:MAG TPA: GDSL-type esterase/lipase family protein, partial [Pirellulaceae bacterium]